MASVSIILERKTSKGHPVKVRISCGPEKHTIHTGLYLEEKQWDGSSVIKHPDKDRYNQIISGIVNQCRDIVISLMQKRIVITAEWVKRIYMSGGLSPDLFPYMQKIIDDLKASGRTGNAAAYKNTKGKLEGIYTDLKFRDINPGWLLDFQKRCQMQKMKTNSINFHLRTLRAVFNRAINEELIDHYPFRNIKMKRERVAPNAFNIEQMRLVASIELSGQPEAARDYFMFMFYCIGMNSKDLFSLNDKNIRGDRIMYQRAKTHRFYNIKYLPQASVILNRYREDVFFPSRKMYRKWFSENLKRVMDKINEDEERKKIMAGAHLTTYVSRYTWANIARSLGYSKDMIAEALGHEMGNPVTSIYLQPYDYRVMDEMQERVAAAINTPIKMEEMKKVWE